MPVSQRQSRILWASLLIIFALIIAVGASIEAPETTGAATYKNPKTASLFSGISSQSQSPTDFSNCMCVCGNQPINP
jgi:hypothetical protein